MKYRLVSLLTPMLFIGCSMQEDACEDATVAAEQMQQCLALQRQIVKAKDKPLMRTELERRYQADCVEIRYYRDDQQFAVCGNKKKIDKAIEKRKAEQNNNN